MISARFCISGAAAAVSAPLFNLNKRWLSINWNIYWFSGRLQCLRLRLRLLLLLRPCLCRCVCCKFFYYHQLLLTDYTTVRMCVCICLYLARLLLLLLCLSIVSAVFFLWEYRVTDTWNPLNTFVVRTLLFINLSGCLPAGLLFLFCLLLLMKPSKVNVLLCFWFSSSRAHVNQILSLKYNFTGFNNYI